MQSILKRKDIQLFIFLAAFFITNALLAEMIGGKLFSLEKLIGIQPVNWSFFYQENLSFTMTCGVLLWPVVFIFTDIINEYFGLKGVRLLSYLTVGLIIYSFIMIYISMSMPPADFYVLSMKEKGVPDMNRAFNAVFGQGLWIIAGSILAFLLGQLIDVFVFQKIKQRTGEKQLWLRATGSTLVSQFIDSFIVLFIAFYVSGKFPFNWVLGVGLVNFIYKGIVAILLTPSLYILHTIIDRFLGEELAHQLKEKASLT